MRQSVGLLALLGLVSCSPPLTVTEVSPVSPKLREFKAVQILVTVQETSAERTVGYFRSCLISELCKREIFVTYVTKDDPGPAEVKMAIVLSGFRGVSEGARALVGGAAGKAKLTAVVNLADLRSGEDLGAFSVHGKTSINADAGTTSDIVESVAIGVAEVLRRKR